MGGAWWTLSFLYAHSRLRARQGVLWPEHPHLPRSARWGDGENLAIRNHEVVRVARVPDLGKSRVERGLEHGSRVDDALMHVMPM